MSEDIIRVLRVIEYIGPRSWVEKTVAASVHGTKDFTFPRAQIRAATLGSYPEIVMPAIDEPAKEFNSYPEQV